jgi:hypothetical protein
MLDAARLLRWSGEISPSLLGGGSCRGLVAFGSDLGEIWVNFFFPVCLPAFH